MVAYLARCLVEPDAPRPSIETLLHAFLPGGARRPRPRRRDLRARERARSRRRRCTRRSATTSPSCRTCGPGFELSKRVADLADARAVVLAHHGLVTWGETHEESYGLTLELVDARPRVPRRAAAATCRCAAPEPSTARRPSSSSRGCADGCRASGGRCSRSTAASARSPTAPTSTTIAAAAQHARPHAPDRRAASTRRVPSTRTSARRAQRRPGDASRVACSCPASAASRPRPTRGRRACGSSSPPTRTRRSPRRSTRSAARRGSTSARWSTFEYWPLELYKLTLAAAAARARRARRDRHRRRVRHRPRGRPRPRRARRAPRARRPRRRRARRDAPSRSSEAVAVAGDLTEPATVDERRPRRGRERSAASTRRLQRRHRARPASSPSCDEAEWRRSLDVNLTAHFLLTKRVWPVLREQGIGGSLVYVASKNAFAPGAGFGPYSVAKAGLVQLAKIAALEGGAAGHPRERRQPGRDLRRLAPLVGRAPPRARRGARRRRRRARGVLRHAQPARPRGHGRGRRRGGRVPRLRPLARDDRLHDHRRRRRPGGVPALTARPRSSRALALAAPRRRPPRRAARRRPAGQLVFYGHIKSLTPSGDRYVLRLDPAWLLEGVTAARRGGRGPARPASRRRRRLLRPRREPRAADVPRPALGARTVVTTRPHETASASTRGHVGRARAAVQGGNPRHRKLLASPLAYGYWVRVDGDKVRSLDAQYRP